MELKHKAQQLRENYKQLQIHMYRQPEVCVNILWVLIMGLWRYLYICVWVSDSVDMMYYCTCTQGSLVQYLSFIWHSLHRSTIEYHTKVSVYLLSLAADPPSPDNVNERRYANGEERV